MLSLRHRNQSLLAILISVVVSSAQQAPFYKTEKFAEFEDGNGHRRKMCDRQSMIYNDELKLDRALSGLNLSVVLTNYSSWPNTAFFGLNQDGVIDAEEPGLFAVLLDELGRRAGFEWRNSYGIINPLSKEEDGNRTWSDLLAWETTTYDLAAGKWDKTVSRMANEISFPYGWFDASLILVERTGEKNQPLNIWSFLTPFDGMIWLLIATSVVVTGLLYWMLEKLNKKADERALHDAPGAAVFYSALSFTGHMDLQPASMPARILTFSMSFWSLIVIAAYTANMASFLVARSNTSFTIASIEEAELLQVPLCIQGAVAMDDYIVNKYPDTVLIRMKNEKEVFSALTAGTCKAAVVPLASYDTYRRDNVINKDCKLSWEGRVELNVPSGFATAADAGTMCSSLISYVVDLHMSRMEADGFIQRAWQKHLARVGHHTCTQDVIEVENPLEEATNRLSYREMAGIFIVHGFLTSIAALLAFAQWIYDKQIKDKLNSSNLETSDESPPTSTEEDFQGSNSGLRSEEFGPPSFLLRQELSV